MNDMNDKSIRFSMVSNIALYGNDKEKSILSQCDYDTRVIAILEYIYGRKGMIDGISYFTIEDMVSSCGFVPNSHKGRSNDIFRSILSKLQELKIIECNVDFSTFKKYKELLKCKLLMDMSTKFATISEDAREKIYSVEDINNVQLLTYYLYLVARVYKPKRGENPNISGGRHQGCFIGYKKMYEDLEITDTTLVKYNEILTNLDLIRYKNFGVAYIEGSRYDSTRITPNVYTLYEGNEEQAQTNLRENFKLFQLNNPELSFSKKLKNDNRVTGGKIGALNKKEKRGKITQEELELRNELIESIQIKEYISDEIESEEIDDIECIVDDVECVKTEELLDVSVNDKTLENPNKVVRNVYADTEEIDRIWGKPNPMKPTPLQQQGIDLGIWDKSAEDLFG